ncbi:unnamed protein product [Paramecium sonneborni]|uniref:Uncharacterized protein n=1 Tax=Paramecium sonneborni TaxID=65129 RepID=A0A8S1MWP8_9CILI|nr:unnamed protein product [Paramecium sonneborni]
MMKLRIIIKEWCYTIQIDMRKKFNVIIRLYSQDQILKRRIVIRVIQKTFNYQGWHYLQQLNQ